MNRRTFLKASPAFPVATVTAALVLREAGQEPVELDLSVLRVQAGDLVVLSVPGPISEACAARLNACFQDHLAPGVKVIVLGDGMKVDGVLRTVDGTP